MYQVHFTYSKYMWISSLLSLEVSFDLKSHAHLCIYKKNK
jgi:hypothetical protein